MARTATLMTLLLLATAATLLLPAPGVEASPWFDLFTRQRPSSYYPQRRPQSSGSSRAGRDRYSSICRTINPDNYAFPGRVPYPSAPLCPY